MVKKWFSGFRGGSTCTNDAERSDRPKEVIPPEIVDKVRSMILNERKIKMHTEAETVGISIERAHNI